jgi:hypothetical protein
LKKEIQDPKDIQRLEKLGWKNEFMGHSWSWREPKTLALYTYKGALEVINIKKGVKQ